MSRLSENLFLGCTQVIQSGLSLPIRGGSQMKKKLVSSLFLTVGIAFLSACSIKTDTRASDESRRIEEEELAKTRKMIDDLLSGLALDVGGQPGKISVLGIAVREDAEKTVLDDRISVLQVPRKNSKDGTTTPIAKSQMPVFSTKLEAKSLEKISSDTTFVNLNCKQVDPSLVVGLTEAPSVLPAEGSLVLSANTIIVCNDYQFQKFVTSFAADHLVLMNVDSTLVGTQGGLISLSANKLTLIGTNKISSKGEDMSEVMVLSAANIELMVSTQIDGDGTLMLSSTGSNRIPKTDTKK